MCCQLSAGPCARAQPVIKPRYRQITTRIHNTYLGYLTNGTDVVLRVSDNLYEYSLSLLIDCSSER